MKRVRFTLGLVMTIAPLVLFSWWLSGSIEAWRVLKALGIVVGLSAAVAVYCATADWLMRDT